MQQHWQELLCSNPGPVSPDASFARVGRRFNAAGVSPESRFPLVPQQQRLHLGQGCGLSCRVPGLRSTLLEQLPALQAGTAQTVGQGCLCTRGQRQHRLDMGT